MATELGAAAVGFSDGRSDRYDAVELLADGVLKTTRRAKFEHPEFGPGVGETQVRFYSRDAWEWVEPDTRGNGTVWVGEAEWSQDYTLNWKPLAVCVSAQGARREIRDYLHANYSQRSQVPDADALNLQPQSNRSGEPDPVINNAGKQMLVAFRWAAISDERVTKPDPEEFWR
ncbi:hypothetical protein C1Y40_00629 [Mycobacterium talmoniae]|uniref:Uncharacterized protein n=1 Tax=Mycobacterium talmoniae TaxID=1858794 RepID=A0A2S8BRA3_9MYCO|nr:hypothetical protein [Mycobacterium eburneum]PQM49167.1 hypothetical protein C1Y40_00629 [Mycobacterium talmoniae]TDH48138.1 hypothetical protein E2F47_25065 [Mycobacterium eburneum]